MENLPEFGHHSQPLDVQHKTLTTRDGMCKRCAEACQRDKNSFQFKLLSHHPNFRIEEPHEVLSKSMCRICRLFSLIVDPAWEGHAELNNTIPWLGEFLFGRMVPSPGQWLCLGIILQPSTLGSPRVRYDAKGCFPKIQNFPDVVAGWIMKCKEDHGEQCNLADEEIVRQNLKAFKVIDCRRRRVILAVGSFRYVALSYV